MRWFAVIYDAFFGGLLTGYCKVELLTEASTKMRGLQNINGYIYTMNPGDERDPRFRVEKSYSEITLSHSRFDNNYKAIKSYQETLLHEMLHAVFDIYECQCDACKECRGYGAEGGHGVHWQAAASAIERANGSKKPRNFGFGLDLGRPLSLAIDVQCGYHFPNEAVFRSLGLYLNDVLYYIKAWEHANKDSQHQMMRLKSNTCFRHEWTVGH